MAGILSYSVTELHTSLVLACSSWPTKQRVLCCGAALGEGNKAASGMCCVSELTQPLHHTLLTWVLNAQIVADSSVSYSVSLCYQLKHLISPSYTMSDLDNIGLLVSPSESENNFQENSLCCSEGI